MFSFDDKISFQNKKNDILTVGELLIDMISEDYSEDFECDTYKKYFGGSPANIAMNARKLGIKSLITSAVGIDGLGSFLIHKLSSEGIDTSCIQRIDYSTSMVLVTKSKNTPVPIFYRAADYNLEYTESLKEALDNTKIVHFSCWPISRMPSRKAIDYVVAQAKKNDVLVCFDPNYHQMLWEKGEDGSGYVIDLLSKVDIAKPSEDDAQRLFGEDTPENQVKKFLAHGVKLVIMTLGKDGLIASDGTNTLRCKSLATKVEDTTGAGDAFWAGFYTAVVKGYTIKEAIMLGNAVSAYKLMYTGAVADLPKLEEIKEMYNL